MIQTERLLLRPWRETDREPFFRMNSDPAVMRYFPRVLSRGESDALVDRIEAQWAARGFTFYAAELQESGDFIGFIGLSVEPFLSRVEIGWRLAAA